MYRMENSQSQGVVDQQCQCIGWNFLSRQSVGPIDQMDHSLDQSIHDVSSVEIPVTQHVIAEDTIEKTPNSISTIPQDISCAEQALPENWEEDYFKKFEWLLKGEDFDEMQHSTKNVELEKFIHMMEKHSLEETTQDIYRSNGEDEVDDYLTSIKKETSFLKSISIMLDPFIKPHVKSASNLMPFSTNTAEKLDLKDPAKSPLYLYYVSLTQNKMLLHATVRKPDQMILDDCYALYQYAQVYEPVKIVYTMQIQDLYDVDKYVKLFMNMFGVDDCRGGSYVDMELSEAEKSVIIKEGKTASIDHYIEQENAL